MDRGAAETRHDTAAVYEFGPFRLEPGERRLLRAGAPVPITPKMFATACVLVEQAPHVVAQEEIIRRVWADATVEEANLTVTISALRRVLKSDADGAPYIETVPKRGYRFVAAVTTLKAGNLAEW